MNTIFYESIHGMDADYFKVKGEKNFSYPLHLHRCFEVILVLEGQMQITVEEKAYSANENDVILIKPHQIHALQATSACRHVLCIFSPELIGSAADLFQKRKMRTQCVPLREALCKQLFLAAADGDSIYKRKSFLYAICELFREQLEGDAEQGERKDFPLLRRVFSFIEQHYEGDCSLKALATHLNYSYPYLSKMFTEHVGMTYSDYVTQFRMSKACYLLQNTSEPMIEIAYRCGCASVRSFNRNFVEIVGKTPSAYRHAFTGAIQSERNTKS